MEIKVQKQGTVLVVIVKGKIDTMTASDFGQTISDNLEGVTRLTLDFSDVSYVSSMGLRMLLECQKNIRKQDGEMQLINVQPAVMDVLKMTGFTKIVTILNN